MDDDRLLSLLTDLVGDLLDDGRIDADEWRDLAHGARLLILDAGASLPEAIAHIVEEVRDLRLLRPKPERLLARAARLEARAIDLRMRAAGTV